MCLQAIKGEKPDLGMGDFPIDKRLLFAQNATIQTIRGAALYLGDSMPNVDDRLLTANELAEIFQVSRDEIYRLARRGTIPGYKIGGVWRFELPEVKRETLTRANSNESD